MSGKEYTEYTHKDLSRLLGVSETTVKSYRRKFPDCIPVAGYGKPIRFGEDALRVARRIHALFEYGLSVDETRARLAEEFDWITSPRDDADKQQPAPAEDETPRADPNVLLAGLARSIVDIFLGQKEIVKRLDHLAVLLRTPPAAPPAPAPAQSAGRKTAPEPGFEQPGASSEEYGFADARDESGLEPEGCGEACAEHDLDTRAAEPEGQACLIFPLRRQDATELPASDAGPARMPERSQVEPPRRFLALPLMAEAGNGGYIGAGGKRRGRFSLNDLKALFVFTFAPPRHFNFLWEEHEDAWMLRLEQEQEGRRIDILLGERPLREGGAAAVILCLEENGEDRHPAEIRAIIDAVGA
jgi:hypothetical protein